MNGDLQIQLDVIAELVTDPSISSALIGVEVQNGIVTLTGQVIRVADIRTAEHAVMRVAGVRAVVRNLVVNTLSGCAARSSRPEFEVLTKTINLMRLSPT